MVTIGRWLLVVLGLVGCERHATTTTPQPTANEVVTWSQVRAELDALVCIETMVHEGTTYHVPVHGKREQCKLPPPATALARATTAAFTSANEVIRAYPHISRATQEAAQSTSDESARLTAVRAALFDDRVLAALQRRLEPALAAEGLQCSDCPRPPPMQPRMVSWSELAPYLAAYIWPDPVVTPRGPDGKPSGDPTYSLHMCVGINGIDRMTRVDEDLRFATLLTAFVTEPLFERVPELFTAARDTPEYAAITDDEARTEYLRAHVGPAVAADPAVRAGFCAALARFADDTPIRLSDCPQ